jgi:S-adenosyl-L-methionine-dependent methyltransferase
MRRSSRYPPPHVTESDYELVQVASGAWSVRARIEGETFHPVIGPQAEAEALYVRQMDIPARFAKARVPFVVWDVGLGAAANVLTVLRALTDIDGDLVIESFDHTAAPLKFALSNAAALGYVVGFETPIRDLLTHGQTTFQNGRCRVTWRFHEADFPTWLASEATRGIPGPDAILFDAFSPARNPAMWTLAVFRGLRQRVPDGAGGTLATYSRSTLLRVTLLLAGFHVGAGEATGEKEETTFAAADPSLVTRPLDATWLGRALRSTSAEPLHTAIYAQRPLSESSRVALEAHPQFQR